MAGPRVPGSGSGRRDWNTGAVAAAVFVLHDIAGLGEAGDDAPGGALV